MKELYLATCEWECGICLASDGKTLQAAGFDPDRVVSRLRKHFPRCRIEWNPAKLESVLRQLEEYLQGERKVFDVPVHLRGTRFQLRVWNEIRKIPYGQTETYGNLAKALGDVRLSRAVGRAVGTNPVPLIIPCHRVVGTGDRLGGYLGGPAVKKRLLELEGIGSL
jgi:O-6-methylguanine DNA methyltransferase